MFDNLCDFVTRPLTGRVLPTLLQIFLLLDPAPSPALFKGGVRLSPLLCHQRGLHYRSHQAEGGHLVFFYDTAVLHTHRVGRGGEGRGSTNFIWEGSYVHFHFNWGTFINPQRVCATGYSSCVCVCVCVCVCACARVCVCLVQFFHMVRS